MGFTEEQIHVGEWVRQISAASPRGWKAFYHTALWRVARGKRLEKDHHQCQRCRRHGIYTRATTVHHVQHLRDVPELALDQENLESLCSACHEAEHPERRSRKKIPFSTPERW